MVKYVPIVILIMVNGTGNINPIILMDNCGFMPMWLMAVRLMILEKMVIALKSDYSYMWPMVRHTLFSITQNSSAKPFTKKNHALFSITQNSSST